MTTSRLRAVAASSAAALLALLLPATAPAAAAAPERSPVVKAAPGRLAPLVRRDTPARSSLLAVGSSLAAAPTASLLGPPRSTWQVTYTGFDAGSHPDGPAAQAAFQAAVDTWSRIVASPVPIEVEARFTLLPAQVLGSAGPSAFYSVDGETYAPSALADAQYGADVGPLVGGPDADITTEFTSDPSAGFSFRTDGVVPSGKVDFLSVVLHELGHGLGFAGSMDVWSGQGSYQEPMPFSFDRWAYDAPTGGAPLLARANPSADLAQVLQSQSVWWGGPEAVSANGGARPRLYAPATWQPGSSFAHLDEATYPRGSADALMTPSISAQEVIHSPGPLAVAMLRDEGWDAALPSSAGPAAPTGLTATRVVDGTVLLSWQPGDASLLTGHVVAVHPVSGGAPTLLPASALTTFPVTGLDPAAAVRFSVAAVSLLGTGAASPLTAPVVPDATAPVLLRLSAPPAFTRSTSAALSFQVLDTGSPTRVLCALDGSPAVVCPASFSGLGEGAHTVQAVALDAAGNASGVVTTSWLVDVTAPALRVAAAPLLALGPATGVSWTASDGGSAGLAYRVRTRKAPWNGAFGAWSASRWTTGLSDLLTTSRGWTTCTSVAAVDRAGNSTTWSAERCTSVPLDDRAMSASAGWQRLVTTGAYAGTTTRAVTAGRRLALGTVTARRLGLVATTCPSCGSVTVAVGATVRTVSLVSAVKRTHVLLPIDLGAVRTGSVVVTTRDARAVVVDGIAVSRV